MKRKKQKRIIKKIVIVSFSTSFIAAIILLIMYLSTDLRCPEGYTLYDNKCGKIIAFKAKITKYCNEVYELNNDICTRTEILPPQIDYYCDNTYKVDGVITISESTLNGEKCTYIMSHEPIQKKTCLYGAEPYSDTKCRITIPTMAASRIDPFTGKIMYYCIDDDVLVGNKCFKYAYSDYHYESICATEFYLNNKKCTKTSSYDASWKATCPEGYNFIDKNTCKKIIIEQAKYNYECRNGYYLEDKKCKKIIYYKGKKR